MPGFLCSNLAKYSSYAKKASQQQFYCNFRFNGLLAPHWRTDARGTMVGLTQYIRREHMCRATLEAVAFQVSEILLAMEKDSGQRLKALLVDGGMTKNDLLMQIQANFNGTLISLRRLTVSRLDL